ncbi:hypothetical protein D0469_13650 [Peribacillus saganii]|uniref:Uncharacterized protein n=1 Tax=Peribacillus saganii TaxID=2303992 RepID=A0A372LLI4_9BACI|nr:hypothetical protein [Peribacillus saganii]RFU67767.1 hypothetical protein D0469_13650 [Peribacillus saganii]
MIRDITDMFNRHLLNIILINLVLVMPFTFFIFSAIAYFGGLETIQLNNLIIVFLIIINFTALFPPFFYMAKNDLSETPYSWMDLLKVFFGEFGYIGFFTIVLFLIGMFGSVLLFIPTVLATAAILLIPLFSDEKSIRKSISGVWKVLKEEHIFILLDVLIIAALNLLVWSGSLYLLADFENNSFVYIIVRVLLNAFLFPLIFFYLTIKYRKDLGAAYGE